MALRQERIEADLLTLGRDGFTANAASIALNCLPFLLPPENISTTDCAVKYRRIKNPEGAGDRPWSLNRTPFMADIQAALDDPKIRLVAVVGPERSGKSVGGENLLFKRMMFGPLTDTIIYMPPGTSVDAYADKEFRDFFLLHHDQIGRFVSGLSKDNKRKFKRFKGRALQLLPMNDPNLRQREAALIIASEIDALSKPAKSPLAAKVVNEILGRQKSFGKQAKAYVESHPDLGSQIGIAAAWATGTRGVLWWGCPSCGGWSTAHQQAPRGMRAQLHYDRDNELDSDARADKVRESAVLLCPHQGCLISDSQRYEMIDASKWVHAGQSIDIDGVVTGKVIPSDRATFWIHGLNVKRPLSAMAMEHFEATLYFERTKKPDMIKRFHVKTLGEVYEGSGTSSRVLDANELRLRNQAEDRTGRFARGTVPDGFSFITAAIDVGARKFDVLFTAWDLEGRSAFLDRLTVFDILGADGFRKDIRPPERIEDWLQLRDRVLRRVFPFASNPAWGLPVAAIAVDTGGASAKDLDGLESGSTWKAREFARRMMAAGESWDSGRVSKVKLIKGVTGEKAPEVGPGREVNVDEAGRAVSPTVLEFNIQVNKLKTLNAERLAIEDQGPGQVWFADGLPKQIFDELSAESRIDGIWTKTGGANETLDLFNYCEAARIMLRVDRDDVIAALSREDDQLRPIWARPVQIDGKENSERAEIVLARPVTPAKSIFDRFAELNGDYD